MNRRINHTRWKHRGVHHRPHVRPSVAVTSSGPPLGGQENEGFARKLVTGPRLRMDHLPGDPRVSRFRNAGRN